MRGGCSALQWPPMRSPGSATFSLKETSPPPSAIRFGRFGPIFACTGSCLRGSLGGSWSGWGFQRNKAKNDEKTFSLKMFQSLEKWGAATRMIQGEGVCLLMASIVQSFPAAVRSVHGSCQHQILLPTFVSQHPTLLFPFLSLFLFPFLFPCLSVRMTR